MKYTTNGHSNVSVAFKPGISEYWGVVGVVVRGKNERNKNSLAGRGGRSVGNMALLSCVSAFELHASRGTRMEITCPYY
jgi:hypothetical protein